MNRSPSTQPTLVRRLRDNSDREAWSQFVELYGPVIYGYVRRRGLQDADAADVTQEVLRCTAHAPQGIVAEAETALVEARIQHRALLQRAASEKK